MADEKLTYTPAEAAAMIPCKERWLVDQLRAGRFPGRKIARDWRMTRADIEEAIEISRYGSARARAAQIIDTVSPHTRRRMRS